MKVADVVHAAAVVVHAAAAAAAAAQAWHSDAVVESSAPECVERHAACAGTAEQYGANYAAYVGRDDPGGVIDGQHGAKDG